MTRIRETACACLCFGCVAAMGWMLAYPAQFTNALGAAADAVFRTIQGVIA